MKAEKVAEARGTAEVAQVVIKKSSSSKVARIYFSFCSYVLLAAGLGCLALSYLCQDLYQKQLNVNDDFIIDVSVWTLCAIGGWIVIMSLIALTMKPQKAKYTSLCFLLLLGILISLILSLILVFIGVIKLSNYTADHSAEHLEEKALADPFNTFQAVIYNTCCSIEVDLSSVTEEEYYYSIAAQTPQQVEVCPVDLAELSALCNEQSHSEPSCFCINDQNLYTKIAEFISSDYCILLEKFYEISDFSDTEICGYDLSQSKYFPKLFQTRFASASKGLLLPAIGIFVSICVTFVLLFCSTYSIMRHPK